MRNAFFDQLFTANRKMRNPAASQNLGNRKPHNVKAKAAAGVFCVFGSAGGGGNRSLPEN